MQQDRSSGYSKNDVLPAGAEPVHCLRLVGGSANHRHPKGVPRPPERAAENPGKVEPGLSSMQPVFRTEVAVCELTVTGVLPDTVRPLEGAIAIGGDVRRLSCDEALELVDALLLVVTRMDVVAEEPDRPTADTTHDPED